MVCLCSCSFFAWKLCIGMFSLACAFRVFVPCFVCCGVCWLLVSLCSDESACCSRASAGLGNDCTPQLQHIHQLRHDLLVLRRESLVIPERCEHHLLTCHVPPPPLICPSEKGMCAPFRPLKSEMLVPPERQSETLHCTEPTHTLDRVELLHCPQETDGVGMVGEGIATE